MWESDDQEIISKLEDEEFLIREIFRQEINKIYDFATASPNFAPDEVIRIIFYECDFGAGRIWCNLSSDNERPSTQPLFELLIREGQITFIEDVDRLFEQSITKHREEINRQTFIEKYRGYKHG